MNLKKMSLAVVLLTSFALAQEQSKKMVSVPEDQLTEQQKVALKIQTADTVVEKAHGWVGIGKELGQAFDSALGSLTIRSNEFAGTRVGKFTMFIVAWKVMGEQAVYACNAIVHIFSGFVELIIFVPVFLWSYRRTCFDRSVLVSQEAGFMGKKTYTIVKYEPDGDFHPRHGHMLALGIFTIIWIFTTFAY